MIPARHIGCLRPGTPIPRLTAMENPGPEQRARSPKCTRSFVLLVAQCRVLGRIQEAGR
jgi:hypothetical protein